MHRPPLTVLQQGNLLITSNCQSISNHLDSNPQRQGRASTWEQNQGLAGLSVPLNNSCCLTDRRMGEGEEVGASLIIREAGTIQAVRTSEATHMEALDAPWELDQVLLQASSLLCGTMSKTLQVLFTEQCSRMEAG